jgi:Cu+-exporting ATPase
MALELQTATAALEDASELRDLTRRLWIGGSLALPVIVLAMAHVVPAFAHVATRPASRWVQFILSTPVVWWAGWPLFVRGAQSIRHRHWNVFTLIALSVGAAWIYSVAAFFLPGLIPPIMPSHGGRVDVYFEATAVVVVLVLVGRVLELRARARTSSDIRALLSSLVHILVVTPVIFLWLRERSLRISTPAAT